MSHLYFAFGSNMSPATIHERVGSATPAGAALLRNHRLAFTLPSMRWTGRAADVLPAPGAGVWGVLWELPDPGALDEFEKRYDRAEFDVLRFGQGDQTGTQIRAFTYTTKPEHRAPDEAPPAPAYLERMIEGAQRGDLPTDYISFLRSCGDPEHFEHRLIVLGTVNRSAAKGLPLGRMNPVDAKFKARRATVTVGRRSCIIDLELSEEVAPGHIHLDQRLREAMGIGGRVTLGWRCDIEPAVGRVRTWGFAPRSLVLPLYRASKSDTELRTVVLHERLLSALGVNVGEYVELIAVERGGGEARLRSASVRVHSGVGDSLNRDGLRVTDYPSVSEIYADLDTRQALGFGRDDAYMPVVVRPDIQRALVSRMWLYLLTTFLGYEVFDTILGELGFSAGWPGWLRVGVVLATALVVAVVIAWVDLRSRIGV